MAGPPWKEKAKQRSANKLPGAKPTGLMPVKPQPAAGNAALPDYKEYELQPRLKLLAMLLGGIALYAVGYLFYHRLLLPLLLVPGGGYAPRLLRDYLLQRRRAALTQQFKQTLFSLSSSLSAGRSVENAFREAVIDLRMLDPDGRGDMAKELGIICARMEFGQPVEEALHDFSQRAGMEDVERFADVFSVCKRTGGDLVEIVRHTSSIIGEKLEIQQEISVAIAQKKFEAKAMLAAPLMMVMFMSLTAGDYMQPMYTGMGIVISTLALAGLVLCYRWTSKIMDISL